MSNNNPKVLISPAHYFFSDKLGSEPGYSYNLVKFISKKIPDLDVIVGIQDLEEPLQPSLNLISIYKSRSQNPAVEFFKYAFFYPLVCLTYLKMGKRYDIVHHMFPTSPKTIDPLLILVKLIHPKTKIIIGPLQLLSDLNSPQDLSIMLVGKKSNLLLNIILNQIFKFLVSITTPISKLTYRTADVIVCNFYIIKNFYRDVFSDKKIEVISTGVEFKEHRTSKGNKELIIISVGRLMKHKGHKYLIEAFGRFLKQYPKSKLVIIGEGDLRTEYEEYIKKNKFQENVIFTGQLNRNKVEQWYQSSDIFCLPSLIDTNPAVVMEAMLFQLPVIATNVGAVAEIVDKAGIIVEKENVSQIYESLLKLAANSKMRKEMGAIGKSRIKKLYNWEIISDQWADLYKKVSGK